MVTQQYESRSYGHLISLKRTRYGYIAPAYKGIVRFNECAEIVELGLDHNSTYKTKNPVKLHIVSTDETEVLAVKTGKPRILLDALIVRHKVYTNKGKFILTQRIDANNDGEIVFTFAVKPCKKSNENGNIAIEFNIMSEFVEMINTEDKQLAVLENGEGQKIVANSIRNIESISIDSKLVGDEDITKCVVVSDKVLNTGYYMPIVFKIALINEEI